MEYKEAMKQAPPTEVNYEVMLAQAEHWQDMRIGQSYLRTIPAIVCDLEQLIALLRSHIELTTALFAKVE